jgi:NADH dehydrogenase
MPAGETARAPDGARPRVVVVGGGFAGLYAARGLRDAAVDLTIVDRRNFHLFQPLAYQVATGALSPAEIAAPLRSVFKRQANARVLLAEVTGFDLDARTLALRHPRTGDESPPLPYDTLIVAGGSSYSYFGHDEWRPYATELK